MFGWSPMPYFIISILQNFLVGVLVFILAQQLFHRLRISFIASLILTIAFPPIQVVTWITGSTVSLLACFYLGTTVLFIQFLSTEKRAWYFAALACFAVSIYCYEYAISLLPVMCLMVLFLSKEYRISLRRGIVLLAPCFALLIPYAIFEIHFIQIGSSEAQVGNGLRFGMHIFPNFLNLSHLIIPDLHFPRLTNYLTSYFPLGLNLLSALTPIGELLWVAGSLIVLIKGSPRTRILIIWVYLAFAPFTLWVDPDIAHSSRYLYLPMTAFSILLGLFFDQIGQWLAAHNIRRAQIIEYAVIGVWLIYNLIPIAIFQAQEISKGQVRRNIIEQIQVLHPTFAAGSQIYVSVPDQNYRDLEWGIPDFYKSPVKVFTVPPETYPKTSTVNTYYFQYNQGHLIQVNTP
jgi:hypothetical protein